MAQSSIRILQTVEHRCGYYHDRWARNLVIDPAADQPQLIYDAVTSSGFRRAGELIFRPHCRGCVACQATRVRVAAFRPSRSQRRCWRRNQDLAVRIRPARFTLEYFELYDRYLSSRHPGGGMDNPCGEDFESFLLSAWAKSFFVELRADNGALLGVAVCDRLSSGLSAVYSFFDPGVSDRGLGNYCILAQIAYARKLNLPYLYLGYWIPGHPKMDYKLRYRPIEVFAGGRWCAPTRPRPGVTDGSVAPADLKARG